MQLSRPALLAGALAALTLTTAAQLTASVQPAAPLGGTVAITMSNDSAIDELVGQACPYNVYTPAGAVVYSIDCPTFVATPLPAGTVLNFFWDQYDDTFTQVPAGDYVVEVELPDGTTPTFKLSIGGTPAGIALLGAPLLGAKRSFFLQSPGDPGGFYAMAASTATAPGIPTCGGTIPLVPNGVFAASLSGGSTFVSFSGLLDGVGATTDPLVAIPTLPSLAGATIVFDFLVLDFGQPCPIQTISAPLSVVLI
jgi:hypothetical protein